MANRAHIQYTGDPRALKKELRPIVKEVLQETVEEWHDNVLPSHFKPSARTRYKYRPRSLKYKKRKQRQRFHDNSLEFTGEMKRKTVRQARITGSAKSARATMLAPWYATKNFRGKDTYADEMTAVTPSEANKMAKKLSEEIPKKLTKKQRSMKSSKRKA